jgi:cytochrome c-type biogenesis protein CcmH
VRRRDLLRGFLTAAYCLLLSLAVSVAGAEARTPSAGPETPSASHPSPAPEGAAGETEATKGVTSRLLCMCGTCVNQSIHECTCGTAANQREKIAARLAAGSPAETIIQEYVEEYGPQVLTTPEKTGLNLVGWLVPFLAAILGLAALTFVLRGWVRTGTAVTVTARPGVEDPVERRYRERLEKELKDYEA